ncbi:MAG TPA: TIM-barrel domain-containing protein [Myxococcota bacterium]
MSIQRRSSARVHLLSGPATAILLAFAGCGGCGVPETASLERGDVVVTVDGAADAVRIARGAEQLVVVGAADIGTKLGEASFDMQFGMFDIVEDDDPFAFGEALAVTAASDDAIDFEVTVGVDDPRVLATGRVTLSTGGVRVDWTAVDGNRVLVKTPCGADHHFIGLGAQSADVDHRGQNVPLWVSEQGIGKSDTDELPTAWQLVGRRHTTHVPMPAFLRSDAVGVVVDTSAFARFDFCAADVDVTSLEVWEPTLRLEVLPAATVLGAQQLLSESLGRPRLLAPYVFAPWNDAIFSEQEVRDFAQFLRDEEIPSSVIWSEDWRGGALNGTLYRLDEDWRLDRALYPTYEDMTATLRAQGFAHQVYFNTFVTEGGDVFDEITSAGHDVRTASTGETFLFTGADRAFSPTALLDLTNDAAWNYVRDEHLKVALDLGARGWMVDYAEWMPVNDAAIAVGDPELVHNHYPVLWSQVNREAVEQAGLLDEVVLYSRAGHLGSPKVVDVMWAGDQRTTFDVDDGLPTIIPIGIGLATTGFTYFAHDIAGYQSSTNDPVSKELFFRWTTLGAFSPVMRTHHGTHAAANHNLRTDADSTAHWKRYAELHIRLYPYLRALAVADATADAGLAAGHGRLALWTPLPVLFPGDDVWAIKDEVMLGPSLLVAPVVTKDAVSREVTLPSGRFVFFPTPGAPAGAPALRREAFEGPGEVSVGVAVGEIAVLMPAGAIVPLTATPAMTLLDVDDPDLADLESTTGDREVVVALGKAGRFVEDDGASYELTGTGTTLPAGVDDDGAIDVVGNQVIEGQGFTLRLSGHPATRRIKIVLR